MNQLSPWALGMFVMAAPWLVPLHTINAFFPGPSRPDPQESGQ